MREVTIEKLGALGDGIARDGGAEIYVPYALPGEIVSGDISNGRMDTPKIITPSPARIKPVCRHYKSCGGCTMQHTTAQVQADWKLQKTKDALSAVNLHPEVRISDVVNLHSRRRATLSVKRTKKGAMVGFYGRGSDNIIEITECAVIAPEILALFPALIEIAILGASRKAALRVAVTLADNGMDLSIENGKELDAPQISKLAQIAGRANIIRLAWNGEIAVQSDPPRQTFAGVAVFPPAGSFLQATKLGEQQLQSIVAKIVGDAKQVVDLFAGCGTFAIPLARMATVVAYEGDAAMMGALDQAWRGSNGLRDITTHTRDLFRRAVLAEELCKTDAVVIDPPRAGALAQTKELAKSDVAKIAFVSCNPATFARDARVLVDAGYSLNWVQVVDQFLFNPHVELVAEFTRP
ncbi:RNA methyltransferase [Amylibacter marinus]|uniref:RNA methyltransferase n=1 Tax=Amylibacter marinus TaxID=1475483 RepID=A0ABQ5VW23_9RHOB|nr:class I SAM-dependent RNA methyltransferase [Amylibacter marinus]GLQ35384.1 RNA methyltransferase [Amylibacter marinus]